MTLDMQEGAVAVTHTFKDISIHTHKGPLPPTLTHTTLHQAPLRTHTSALIPIQPQTPYTDTQCGGWWWWW